MNSVVEKLAAIEKEVAAIQPKMAPLTERIADLHHKVTGFTQQLADLAAESVAVKQDVELTQQSLIKIQTLIGESKVESEQLVAGQEENQQRCETMTAVFGAAFQAMSQFFETAQQMGLADQAKAVFLAPSSPPASLPPLSVPVAPPVVPDPPVQKSPITESVLSESDFDSAIPDTGEMEETAPWSVPGLPDVAAPPEIAQADLGTADSDSEADTEPSSKMASQLDVPPLNLAVPALPEQGESAASETDDQEIEDMLATLMTPVTVAAGN